ncbi:hypothetical protein CANMA_002855 [Candida margitis]|uniref:uncharacterized protein n=1 Tax=Candida margitis TaxID=1775924 RepID=UPI0022276881|nr:uncharacterized protein CANMA_002855 [Candida margitis]KAI5967675.1 hypothetical protein CANMA_002855 [Candida margitis]
MINKNLNLHLKLNKMEFNQPSISTPSGLNSQPYTPIDQTLKTPLEAPGQYPFNPPPLHHQNSYNNQNTIQQQQSQQQGQFNQNSSFYQNPQYSDSDDILTDIDDPEASNDGNNSSAGTNNTSLKRPPYPMANGMKNTSISNLSLNEMNLMNYNAQQQQAQAQGQVQPSNASIRSRSSSLNLRKQSLTRNNSNNWLHVGNIHSLRPRNSNASTDSLDCVPIQTNLFNGGGGGSSANSTPPQSAGIQSQSQSNYFPQQPLSIGGTIQTQTAYFPPPPPSEQPHVNQEYPAMTSSPFVLPSAPPPFLQRSRSGGGAGAGPSVPYHLNTESANAQALNSLNGRSSFNPNTGFALDSPFEPQPPHQHPQPHQQQSWSSQPCGQQYAQQYSQQYSQQRASSLSSQSSQSSSISMSMQDDAPMDEARFNSNFNTNYVSLSEKKRDSLKLKRGMH